MKLTTCDIEIASFLGGDLCEGAKYGHFESFSWEWTTRQTNSKCGKRPDIDPILYPAAVMTWRVRPQFSEPAEPGGPRGTRFWQQQKENLFFQKVFYFYLSPPDFGTFCRHCHWKSKCTKWLLKTVYRKRGKVQGRHVHFLTLKSEDLLLLDNFSNNMQGYIICPTHYHLFHIRVMFRSSRGIGY